MRRVSRFAIVLTVLVGALVILSAIAAAAPASTAPSDDKHSIGLIQAAGGTLTGIVKDKDNRSANGAQVILSQGSQEIATTITGSSGSFNFLEAAGTYELTINYTGYEIYNKTVTLVDGQTLDLGYIMLTPVPNYFWILMDIVMVVGAVTIFLVVGKRVRKL